MPDEVMFDAEGMEQVQPNPVQDAQPPMEMDEPIVDFDGDLDNYGNQAQPAQPQPEPQPEPQPPVEPTAQEEYGQPQPANEEVADFDGHVPAPEAHPPVGSEPEGPKFPKELLDIVHMSEEDAVKQFGTPERLEQEIAQADQRWLSQPAPQPEPEPYPQWQQPQYQQPYPPGSMAPAPYPPLPQQYGQPPVAPYGYPPAPMQPGQPAPPHNPYGQPQPNAPLPEIQLPPTQDGSEWDPDLKNLVTQMYHQNQQALQARDYQLAQQQQALESLLEQQMIANQQRTVVEVDNFVQSLGDEWSATFGDVNKGGRDLKNDAGGQFTMQLQNRAQLDRVASQMEQNMIAAGQELPSRQQLLRRALISSFPRQAEQNVQRGVEQKLAQRQSMMTARPVSRRSAKPGKQPSNVERAIQVANKWLKENRPEGTYSEPSEQIFDGI